MHLLRCYRLSTTKERIEHKEGLLFSLSLRSLCSFVVNHSFSFFALLGVNSFFSLHFLLMSLVYSRTLMALNRNVFITAGYRITGRMRPVCWSEVSYAATCCRILLMPATTFPMILAIFHEISRLARGLLSKTGNLRLVR